MRKITVLFFVMLLAMQVTGCAESKTAKSESEIREIAYQHSKKGIIDWQSGKVEEYKPNSDYWVFIPNTDNTGITKTNIKGRDTYKVTFKSDQDALLGPITCYVDKETYQVLGHDLRY